MWWVGDLVVGRVVLERNYPAISAWRGSHGAEWLGVWPEPWVAAAISLGERSYLLLLILSLL